MKFHLNTVLGYLTFTAGLVGIAAGGAIEHLGWKPGIDSRTMINASIAALVGWWATQLIAMRAARAQSLKWDAEWESAAQNTRDDLLVAHVHSTTAGVDHRIH